MKQQKVKPKMDGLARPGASKGVSKRSHFQYSGASWIGEPGGQGTGELGGQGTRGPVGLSTHESDGRIREPGGPSTRELGGPGTRGPVGLSTHESDGLIREPGGPSTRGPVGLSSRDLQKSFTRSDTSRTQPIQKGQSYNWLQNEENRNSFSSCQSPVTVINHGEEDDQEDTHEIDDAQTETDTSDDELEENIGSTSHGKTITRKETRALGETRKSCLNKKNLAFEVDDCSGRIVGDDSQRFITKGGCVMRKFAKLDGTTWKNQPDLLKRDIITKSVHIPGHIKGRSASTTNILGNEKLKLDLESEMERSQALKENMNVMNKKQHQLQKHN
ncbi:hypothetical protein Tco_0945855 [Tanacetum coccineum]